jgi:plasmid stability protein
VRTTITLDDDVAAKLRSQSQRSGRPFRDVVNDVLRRGLARPPATPAREPFRVVVRDLGARRPDLSLDNIAELIERVEGPLAR